MIGFRGAWLGLIVALCACGKSFDAGQGAGGSSGGAGNAGTSSAGSSAQAGSGGSTGGAGAASGSGGLPNMGGLGGIGGTGGLPGIGGTGGVANSSPVPTLGLSLWLRADQGVTQKNGLVQEWLDQSGQHMDAIQTAANVQPKFVNDGLNGKPTLDFDGIDDFMKLPAGFADFSQGLSMFMVVNATDGTCASMLEMSNGTEVQDISLGLYQFAWQYEVEDDDAAGGVIDPSNAKPALVAAIQGTSGDVELRQSSNLIDQEQFSAPEVVLRQDNFIGHTLYASCGYFQGQISEILVYDRVVTDKEVLAIEGYLEDRWQISTAMP
ncbi:MAG TPA: hypothetical protein VHV51_16505 [Polyangiaceae bacterium]|nr:hypothetical protein [Polyangiaceae bacterium]